MKNKTVAVLVGFIVAFILSLAVTYIYGELSFGSYIARHSSPTLVGGIITGYLVRRLGWLYGFLVAVLVEALGLALSLWLFVGQYHVGMTRFLNGWLAEFYLPLAALIAGTIGGLLGQLLAQKLRRKTAD